MVVEAVRTKSPYPDVIVVGSGMIAIEVDAAGVRAASVARASAMRPERSSI
jgi:hypothetical protein